jgi:hypothetical protein
MRRAWLTGLLGRVWFVDRAIRFYSLGGFMKIIRTAALAAAVAAALSVSSIAGAATFNYHGTLTTNGAAADGKYDIQLSVYPSANAAVPTGNPITVYNVNVRSGAFNAAVDLGNAAANGGVWVGAAVRKSGAQEFDALEGRTAVAPDGTCPDAWLVGGNTGVNSYVGTADANDFHVAVDSAQQATFAQNGGISLNEYGGQTAPGPKALSVAYSNGAAGDYSIAAGFNAGTVNVGSIVFADQGGSSITDTAPDQFIVSSTGGMMVNGNGLQSSLDDVNIYPRASGGDDDTDLRLVSRSGNSGLLYISDSSGILNIVATNGVHVDNPVQIDGTLSTKDVSIHGSAHMSTAGGFKANSDARIKQDVLPVANALDTLNRVDFVTFEYTPEYLAAHPEISSQRYYNVIAQQFATVFPDAVTGSGEYLPNASKTADNEIRQVDTYPAQIVTMAAVQELSQKNAALQRQVERLLARVEKLEAAQGK